jgi:hypothetical protein
VDDSWARAAADRARRVEDSGTHARVVGQEGREGGVTHLQWLLSTVVVEASYAARASAYWWKKRGGVVRSVLVTTKMKAG